MGAGHLSRSLHSIRAELDQLFLVLFTSIRVRKSY